MNTSEVLALMGASLSSMAGLVLAFFCKPSWRRGKRERERLGAHVGSESHPTVLLFVGLLFVAISVVILACSFTAALSGSPRVEGSPVSAMGYCDRPPRFASAR
jgi:hypothetical protein